jgi:hypothetical protein
MQKQGLLKVGFSGNKLEPDEPLGLSAEVSDVSPKKSPRRKRARTNSLSKADLLREKLQQSPN